LNVRGFFFTFGKDKIYFYLNVHTGSGVHPAFCPGGTKDSSFG